MSELDPVRSATRLIPTLDAAGPAAAAGPPAVAPSTRAATTPESPILDGVDRSGGPGRGVRPMGEREALQGAARAVADGGTLALFAWLRASPPALARLGRLSADRIEQGVRRELAAARPEGFLHPVNTARNAQQAATVPGEVGDLIRNIGRMHVRREAQGIVNTRIVELQGLRDQVDRLLPQLRAARPGTPMASMAAMLGVRGADGDAERARAAFDRAIGGLQLFRGDLEGQTWELGDFERASVRALDRMGLAPAGFDSITQTQIQANHANATHAHAGLIAVEGAHAAVEGGAILLHGAIAVPPFAIAALGIGAALYIEHGAQQVGEDRRALGRALGL